MINGFEGSAPQVLVGSAGVPPGWSQLGSRRRFLSERRPRLSPVAPGGLSAGWGRGLGVGEELARLTTLASGVGSPRLDYITAAAGLCVFYCDSIVSVKKEDGDVTGGDGKLVSEHLRASTWIYDGVFTVWDARGSTFTSSPTQEPNLRLDPLLVWGGFLRWVEPRPQGLWR